MDITYILLGALALAALMGVMIYNRLVALRQNREQAFADVDVQLKLRLDLVPNLVETVKGYAAHEKVTAARSGVAAARSIAEKVSAENILSRAMAGIYAVSENYPNLKADATFQKLMAELSDIENKISAARRFFNNATAELNTAIQQFPAVLFAGALGFKQEEFFEIHENLRAQAEQAPAVKFG
jgi:LemA protein